MNAPLRVAVVGMGPKGLYCLERLACAVAGEEGARVEVTVFDPGRSPGAGPVYEPTQPDHLRMNFPASAINAWLDDGCVPVAKRLSFEQWHIATRGIASEEYPPRARVGEYLREAFGTVMAHLPEGMAVTRAARRVRCIARAVTGWSLRLEGRDEAQAFDEVLVATGHAWDWPGALSREWGHRAHLVSRVFPAQRWPRRIAPGARVAVRGFGLTFIDAALTLTEGRGGTFTPHGDGWGLRYQPGPAAPVTLFPYTRSGRPMWPKPTGAMTAEVERAARVVATMPDVFPPEGPVTVDGHLLPALDSVADRITGGTAGDDVSRYLRALAEGPVDGDEDPLAAMVHALDVAHHRAGPDTAWLAGLAWRAVYPALVSALGHGRLVASDGPAFRAIAAEAERLAFGPPAANMARMVALVEAGVIDLRHLAGGHLEEDADGTLVVSGRGRDRVDAVIDAVLPPPGVGDDDLSGMLVECGIARRLPGGRGLDVDADGTCRDADGEPVPGLAAVGRPTEDAVVGNDSLSRTLHGLPGAWAARVARRAARVGASAPA